MKKSKKMNPYLKEAELMPCTYCKMTRRANNNISSMIDENNKRKEDNKNNISQKKMFGTEPKKTKTKKKSNYK